MLTPLPHFGEPWDARIVDRHRRVVTPTGTPCVICAVAIAEGDRGLVQLSGKREAPVVRPMHMECDLWLALNRWRLTMACGCEVGKVWREGTVVRTDALETLTALNAVRVSRGLLPL